MSRWEPHLHWSFEGEHVLFPNLHLHSWPTFIVSCALTIAVCVTERCLSISLDRHLAPPFVKASPWRYVSWRTVIYGLAVCMRLCYMLIAMSFNMSLILTIAGSLASAQLVLVELQELKSTNSSSYAPVDNGGHALGMRSRPLGPRPDSIYIHPADTNPGRADIMALELGMERHNKIGEDWESGRGRDATLLGSHSTPFKLSEEGEEIYLSD